MLLDQLLERWEPLGSQLAAGKRLVSQLAGSRNAERLGGQLAAVDPPSAAGGHHGVAYVELLVVVGTS